MTTKTAPAQRKSRTSPKPILPALAARAGVFSHLRPEPLEHGVRVLPLGVRPRAKAKPKGRATAATLAAPVEVRIERGAGSSVWRELVGLVTTAAVDRLAGVSADDQRRLLADLRETLAEEATSTTSAGILAALRRVAGTSPVASDDLPPANAAAIERAYARGETAQADVAQRRDMLTGEALGRRVGLTRATVDNRRKANQLLALELGSNLHNRELCEGVITEMLGLSPATTSRHLCLLRQAGLVDSEKAGRCVCYRLAVANPSTVAAKTLRWLRECLTQQPQIVEDATQTRALSSRSPVQAECRQRRQRLEVRRSESVARSRRKRGANNTTR